MGQRRWPSGDNSGRFGPKPLKLTMPPRGPEWTTFPAARSRWVPDRHSS